MTDLPIEETLVKELKALAENENVTLNEMVRRMLAAYITKQADTVPEGDALEAFLGAFDDDVTDLSMTVRETMNNYYQKKYGSSD